MFNNSVNSCFINVVKSSEVLKENKKSENINLLRLLRTSTSVSDLTGNQRSTHHTGDCVYSLIVAVALWHSLLWGAADSLDGSNGLWSVARCHLYKSELSCLTRTSLGQRRPRYWPSPSPGREDWALLPAPVHKSRPAVVVGPLHQGADLTCPSDWCPRRPSVCFDAPLSVFVLR